MIPQQDDGPLSLVCFVSHLETILKKVGDHPVAIISINGKQRSGKSFLATQFIKRLLFQDADWLHKKMGSSFTWRCDFEPVTSGIQVWHEPLEVNHNGKKIFVIVVDTQGLHDSQSGSKENAAIFGLSALLSSVFIHNERHAGEDSLQYLRTFLEHAKFAGATEDNRWDFLIFKRISLF